MDHIMVSISCTSYNHEAYIRDALDGMLAQEVDFRYEILIHDDASTDRTQEIIREYQAGYPEIIRPIYQTENQYSRGVKVGILNRERAQGKYIAICEGDDYWTDPHKLQRQIDYLEAHPECSMCFHDAVLADADGTVLGPFPGFYRRAEGIKDIDELDFIPTASKVYRRSVTEDLPQWFYKAPYGDFASMLVCSRHGYIYYINEVMSVYRTNVPESVTYMFKYYAGDEKKILIDKSLGRIQELKDFNEWSGHEKDALVQQMILEEEFLILTLKKSRKVLTEARYRKLFLKQSLFIKLKTLARLTIPDPIYNRLAINTKKVLYRFQGRSWQQ